MAAPMANQPTSFQKRNTGRIPQIRGTKTSLHANLLLTSTGVQSLDSLIGGGLAIGSLLLIEEDAFATYSPLLTKYFVAEGVAHGHSTFLSSSMQQSAAYILEHLPSEVSHVKQRLVASSDGSVDTSQDALGGHETALKIAWRYQNKPLVEASTTATFGHSYDLSKAIDSQLLASADVVLHSPLDSDGCVNNESLTLSTVGKHLSCKFERLLRAIRKAIISRNLNNLMDIQPNTSVMRIVLPGLGSSLWTEPTANSTPGAVATDTMLLRFLYSLKALLRSTLAVCLITVPAYVLKDLSLARHIQHSADCVIRLEGFIDTPKGQRLATDGVYGAYKGFINVLKFPRINTLSVAVPFDQNWAFNVTRKAFAIEKLHLPPDLSDTSSRSQLSSSSSFACGSSTTSSSPLDF